MNCRHCHAELKKPFLDLGSAPHSNAYLTAQTLHDPELWFPLKVLVCTRCWLVQTEDVVDAVGVEVLLHVRQPPPPPPARGERDRG